MNRDTAIYAALAGLSRTPITQLNQEIFVTDLTDDEVLKLTPDMNVDNPQFSIEVLDINKLPSTYGTFLAESVTALRHDVAAKNVPAVGEQDVVCYVNRIRHDVVTRRRWLPCKLPS